MYRAMVLAAACLVQTGEAAADSRSSFACHVRGIRDRAQCLELQVPERWDRPEESRKITIRAAVLPAAGGTAESDPVFVLAGGPGQAAGELGRALEAVFGRVRRQREIVLVDQRGTGSSTPLQCRLPDGLDVRGGNWGHAGAAGWQPAKSCLAGLYADVKGYDSAAFIRDLEAVRKALGYEQINLWGASYGTRAALLYARAYPDRVRTMVLDGVLPPSRNLFESEPRSSQAALDKTLNACEQSPACADAFPELRETLSTILERLKDGPRQFSDSRRQDTPLTVDRDTFMQNLRGALYSPQSAAAIPYIIDRFAAGDARPLFAYAYEINRRVVDRMYLGLTLSVLCAEDVNRADPAAVAAAGAQSLFGTAYYDFWHSACENWPKSRTADDDETPVEAEMPVLLLSGALDPVTPPEAAREARRTLPNAAHFVARSASHNVSTFGCAPKLIAEFIEGADVTKLDPTCLDELGRPPFLVGKRGPQP